MQMEGLVNCNRRPLVLGAKICFNRLKLTWLCDFEKGVRTMKKILAIGLALALSGVLALPLEAASQSSGVISKDLTSTKAPDSYQTTQRARIIAFQGDRLVAYLSKPEDLAVETTDYPALHLQYIPVPADVAPPKVRSGEGKMIRGLDRLLPGQQVDLTFNYSWDNTTTPRTIRMDRVVEAATVGPLLQSASFTTLDELGKNVLIGTVVGKRDNRIQVFVEGGLVHYSGTEYVAGGAMWMTTSSATQYRDRDGRAIARADVQLFDRVTLLGQGSWMESYPPVYAMDRIQELQVLGQGEKLLDSGELAAFEELVCTVLEAGKDENGQFRLVVQPAEGSRQAGLRGRFVVDRAMGDVFRGGKKVPFEAIPVGAELRIAYRGLEYGKSPGRIPWFNRIDWLEA